MLEIDSIELNKFDGFNLNSIDTFKLDVAGATTLILGRNGCGKTRLLTMLSLVCPEKSDFADGGSRVLNITYNAVKYSLSNKFSKSNIKSSIINLDTGAVIVEHANPTLFNGHVASLFGYTKDIHNVLLGRVKLTNMRTAERKKWFSMLSESDLTYALSFNNRAREHSRDLSGAIKSAQYNIGEIKPTVLKSDDDFLALKSRLAALREDIKLIDSAKSIIGATDLNSTDSDLDINLAKINKLNDAIFKLEAQRPEWLDTFNLRESEDLLVELNVRFTEQVKRSSALMQRLDKFENSKDYDLVAMERQVADIELEVEVLAKSNFKYRALLDVEDSTIVNAIQSLDVMLDNLSTALGGLITDRDTRNTNASLTALDKQAQSINVARNQIGQSIANYRERVNTLEHVHDVTCDNCHTTFKPGVKRGDIEAAKQALATLGAKDLKLKEEYDEIQIAIGEYKVLDNHFRLLNTTIQNFKTNPAHLLLLSELTTAKVWINTSALTLAKLKHYRHALNIVFKISKLHERKLKISQSIAIIKASTLGDYDALKAEIDVIEAGVNDIQMQQVELRDRIATFKFYEGMEAEWYALEDQLNNAVNDRVEIIDDLINTQSKAIMDEHHDELWEIYTVANNRYEDMVKQRQRLEDLEAELVILEGRYVTAKRIVKALSPESGILARHLYKCITKITDLMTGYINRIWSYEMTIKSCAIEDGELDYKFPFHCTETNRTSPDISESSLGQQEVVDFVFMLAVYRACNLNGYPLFLDELGKTFNEGHRTDLIAFIKELLGRGHHSQVFMSSHNADAYFGLANAQVVVIDPVGISVPEIYNTGVTIS